MAACLSFVQAFSVFPSAVLLGAPAGPTRVMSIAAAEAAFESYDYSLASAIAMVMGFVQLLVVAAHARRAPLLLQRAGDAEAKADGNRSSCGAACVVRVRIRFDKTTARANPSSASSSAASVAGRLWQVLVWGAMVFFLVNVVLLIATVAVNSVATRWFGTLLPQGFTLHWYAQAWSDFQLASVLWVTVEVVGAVVVLSVAARRARCVCARARAVSRQAHRDAGVPVAVDGAARHVRHSDGDRDVQGRSCRHARAA